MPFHEDALARLRTEWGRMLDPLAASAGAWTRERMVEALRRTVLYEISFWEMALEGRRWPGAPGGESGNPGGSAP